LEIYLPLVNKNTPLGQTVVNLLEKTLYPLVSVVVVDPLCDAQSEYGVVRSIAMRDILKVLPKVGFSVEGFSSIAMRDIRKVLAIVGFSV
jgi:hypothetical protein